MKQKGLGRGLDAIFGNDHLDAKLKPMTEMAEIAVSEIIPNPTQPRTQFDEEALDELADSIRTLGVIQPITVKRQGDGKYIIISGERRWRAAQRADVATLPAYIREVDDENLHASSTSAGLRRTRSPKRWVRSARRSPIFCACSNCPTRSSWHSKRD